jgi:predicted outer membrane repeat protein
MEVRVDKGNESGAEDGTVTYPFNTIQEGIDLAGPGDTVLVADGIYRGVGNVNLDFKAKVITVKSENGAHATVIDAERASRGFYFHSGETAASILEGFTITNGSASSGGGMYFINASSPTIKDCILLNNASTSSAGGGGGMALAGGSSPVITGCLFEGNAAANAGGGISNGIQCNPVVSGCTFDGNSATWGGGAIYNHHSSPVVSDSLFTLNTSEHWGGAVHNNSDDADPVFAHCAFTGNEAQYGGAVYNRTGADPSFIGCTFARNKATLYHGGAIYNQDSATSPAIVGCTFWGNSAFDDGGAIYSNNGCSLRIVNSVFTGNHSADKAGALYFRSGDQSTVTSSTLFANQAAYGGGIYIWGGSTTSVVNCILWENSAFYGPQIGLGNGSTLTISYSNLDGGEAGGIFNEGSIVYWDGASMLNLDPLFAGPYGPDTIAGTEDDDLRLLPLSPCIDSGDNTAVPAGITTDLAGLPRFIDDPATGDSGRGTKPIVDMGAYEFSDTCPGDYDFDQDVDGQDLSSFVDFFEKGDNRADLTHDRVVDKQDLMLFLVDFGRNSCSRSGM